MGSNTSRAGSIRQAAQELRAQIGMAQQHQQGMQGMQGQANYGAEGGRSQMVQSGASWASGASGATSDHASLAMAQHLKSLPQQDYAQQQQQQQQYQGQSQQGYQQQQQQQQLRGSGGTAAGAAAGGTSSQQAYHQSSFEETGFEQGGDAFSRSFTSRAAAAGQLQGRQVGAPSGSMIAPSSPTPAGWAEARMLLDRRARYSSTDYC